MTGWTGRCHRHYLETLDQPYFRSCGAAGGMSSWLVHAPGLVPTWETPCWLFSSSGRSGWTLDSAGLWFCSGRMSLCRRWERACAREHHITKQRCVNLPSAGQKSPSLTLQWLKIKRHLSPWSLQAWEICIPCLPVFLFWFGFLPPGSGLASRCEKRLRWEKEALENTLL